MRLKVIKSILISNFLTLKTKPNNILKTKFIVSCCFTKKIKRRRSNLLIDSHLFLNKKTILFYKLIDNALLSFNLFNVKKQINKSEVTIDILLNCFITRKYFPNY